MTVNINPDDVKLFEDNGFSREQVGATVNHYREQGLSDDDIQIKMNNRLAELRGGNQTQTQEESTPVLQGGVSYNDFINSKNRISDDVKLLGTKRMPQENLWRGFAKGVSSLGTRLGKNVTNKQLRPLLGKEPLSDEQMDKMYGFLDDKPEGIAENVGSFVGNVAPYMLLPEIGAGGGLGSAMANTAYQGATIGGLESIANNGLGLQNIKDAALGAGIGAVLPPVLKSGGAIIKNGLKIVPATGNLIAKSLGRIKPETLQRAVQADSVALDLTEPQAQNLLMNTTEDIQRGYKNLLDKAGRDVQYAAMKLPEDRGVWASSLKDSLDDIYAGYSTSGDRALNPAYNNAGDIYGDIKSLIDAGAIDVKTGQPITDASIDGKISASKLNDIMNNIKNYPIEWNKTTSKDRQAILKQIYGDFSRRLNNLSPELRNANKAYSELAKFDDNEGVRQIIKPDIIKNESIDSASRALKNYNSTVTKGNTNRNIQDLEKILVKNGYEPFIKKIDDINAAMDLLNNRTTGDSWLANITTNLTKPVLKGVRAANRIVQNNPDVQKTISNLKELNPGLYNLLLQGAGRLAGSKK